MAAIALENSHRRLSVAARLGFGLTACALAAIAIMVVIDPVSRSVTPVYISAATKFFHHENFYDPQASNGFLYSPTFALMFSPMTVFGPTVCNLLWRALCLVALAFAMLRAARRLDSGRDALEIVGVALLFALAGAAGAVRNGQSTPLLLAASFLAFEAAYDRRFAWSALWATLAIIAKPPGIVVWLLIGGTRPRVIPWLLGFLALALLAPFAFAEAKFVEFLYGQFAEMLSDATPELGRGAQWTDFMAIIRALGVSLDAKAVDAIRVVAAAATLAGAFALMRGKDYLKGAVLPATLACSYMLLFNPRAEINTYILMAVPYGLLAAYLLRKTASRYAGWTLAAACVALGTGALGGPVMRAVDPWSKPVLLTVCLGVSAFAFLRKADDDAARA
jgi:hypothetical protein